MTAEQRSLIARRRSYISPSFAITYTQQTHDGSLQQDFRNDAFHLDVVYPSYGTWSLMEMTLQYTRAKMS